MPVRITSDEDVPDEFFLDNLTFFIRDEKNVGLQGEITRAEVQTLVASAYFKYQRKIKDTHSTKRTRNNNILDYFLKHQNWYKANDRYIDFIFENRYCLYDALVTFVNRNDRSSNRRGIECKLFDYKVHVETLNVFKVPNYMIHDLQMEVMRNIDNADQVKIMTQEFRKSKPASASMKRKTVDE